MNLNLESKQKKYSQTIFLLVLSLTSGKEQERATEFTDLELVLTKYETRSRIVPAEAVPEQLTWRVLRRRHWRASRGLAITWMK